MLSPSNPPRYKFYTWKCYRPNAVCQIRPVFLHNDIRAPRPRPLFATTCIEHACDHLSAINIHLQDARRRMPANELHCIPTTQPRQRTTEMNGGEQLYAYMYIANISYNRRCWYSSSGFERQLLQRVINCCESQQKYAPS